MNTKKFAIAVIAVFVLLELTNYLVNNIILYHTYMSDIYKNVFRSSGDMWSKMWIMLVADFIWSFFFVFLFVKGYEHKGVEEGIRFGIYIGIFFSFVVSYQAYVVYPLAYPLVLQWFIYGLLQSVILGVATALIYKPKEAEASSPAIAS